MTRLDEPPTHILLGERAGWRAARLTDVEADERGLRLRRRLLPARPLAGPDGDLGGLVAPAGVAVDPQGGVLVLDGAAAVVRRLAPCGDRFETLPCLGGEGSAPRRLRSPKGIAASARGDLYVADTGNRRVQVLALKGLVLRAIWGPFRVTPEGVEPLGADAEDPAAWEPWDVAVGPHGRVFVADRANGRVHVFAPGRRLPTAWPVAPEVPLRRPVRIAGDARGCLYVVEEGRPEVVVLDREGRRAGTIAAPEQVAGRFEPVAVGIDAEGDLYVGERHTGRLHVAPAGGRAYTGSCAGTGAAPLALAFDRAGSLVLADGSPRVVVLERSEAFAPEGDVEIGPLDSGLWQCRWHRLALRASVPEGAAIELRTLTAEAELTAEDVAALPAERWSAPVIAPPSDAPEWDCLVQSGPGRRLWLRMRLTGGGATPVVRSLRASFPRASSLRYLPGIYAEDPQGDQFVARFLSIFDTIRDSVAARLDDMAAWLDPGAAPAGDTAAGAATPDALAMVSAWVGLDVPAGLPAPRRRDLLRHAGELYRRRGTPRGLRRHVELATGIEPLVLEHFRLRRWLFAGSSAAGEASVLWGDAVMRRLQLDRFSRIGEFQLLDTGDPLRDPFHRLAHAFTVFVPAPAARRADVSADTIAAIVQAAKPAHAEGDVVLVEPRFRIGTQARVGLDTIVARPPSGVVEGRARLGVDSVLDVSAEEAEPPALRVGVRARIGSTTVID
jgi:phage tail-like protein